jgi:hypothetical protein
MVADKLAVTVDKTPDMLAAGMPVVGMSADTTADCMMVDKTELELSDTELELDMKPLDYMSWNCTVPAEETGMMSVDTKLGVMDTMAGSNWAGTERNASDESKMRFEDKMAENMMVEGRMVEDKMVEGRMAEDMMAEDKMVEGRMAEDKMVEGRMVEDMMVEAEGMMVEDKLAVGRTTDAELTVCNVYCVMEVDKTAEGMMAEGRTVEDMTVEDMMAEDKMVEGMMVEDMTVEDKMAEDMMVEDKMAEDKTADMLVEDMSAVGTSEEHRSEDCM